MNIDDFMEQGDSYNTNSDTITGYFNLDEEKTHNNFIELRERSSKYKMKSDVMIHIDAITDSKMEAIMLSSIFFEHAKGRDFYADEFIQKLFLVLVESVEKGEIDSDAAELITKSLLDVL